MEIKIGDTVVWETGFYAGEQGQRGQSWWSQKRIGTVIEIDFDNNKCLLEFDNLEREWARRSELEGAKKEELPISQPLMGST